MPCPLSRTDISAKLSFFAVLMVMRLVPPPCCTALSMRFIRSCSTSIASIGTKNRSSGTVTDTVTSGFFFLNLTTTSLRTSSSTSSSFFIAPGLSPLMRVMDSRFSTMRHSHSASFLASDSSSSRWALLSESPLSSTADIAPLIEVSGVRRSCDIARRRFARIFSCSASSLMRFCSLTRAARVDTAKPTASIVTKVSG